MEAEQGIRIRKNIVCEQLQNQNPCKYKSDSYKIKRPMQNRHRALQAALAADSLALGVHWNYSVSSSIVYLCLSA